MIITVADFAPGTPNGTFGLCFIDNIFFSFALQPVKRVIPCGTWPLIPVTSPTWTPKLGGPALWIPWKYPQPIPDGLKYPTPYDYESPANDGGHALFHWGNTVQDTTQCILLGYQCTTNSENPNYMPGVYDSRRTVMDFYKLILLTAQRGDAWVEITNFK